MQIGTAFVFLLMLGAALAFVGWPLANPARAEDEPTARQRRREELQEQKERLLAALRDLDLDHRTGKTDDEDHAALSAKLKADAAATMKEIDALDSERPAKEPGKLDDESRRKLRTILMRNELAAQEGVRVDAQIARRVRALIDNATMRPLPSDAVELAALSREIDDLYLRFNPPLQQRPQPTPEEAKAMMDSFVREVAAEQPPVAGTRFCTKCGWKAKAADDRFCGRCGSALPTDG